MTRSLPNRGQAASGQPRGGRAAADTAATPPRRGRAGAAAVATPPTGGPAAARGGARTEEGVPAYERRTCNADTSSTRSRCVQYFELVIY